MQVIRKAASSRGHRLPLIGAFVVFPLGRLGLAVGFCPNIVPYDLTFREAASAHNALAYALKLLLR